MRNKMQRLHPVVMSMRQILIRKIPCFIDFLLRHYLTHYTLRSQPLGTSVLVRAFSSNLTNARSSEYAPTVF